MTKAVVLCAGYGTRLLPLTEETPKPLLKIAGKPLLGYILENLSRSHVSEVAINLHYHPEKIREYVGDGSQWGLTIQYAYEEKLLGTAGALLNLKDWLLTPEPQDFFVLYGDVMSDQNLVDFFNFHRARQEAQGAVATILVYEGMDNSIVHMDDENRIDLFCERPTAAERRQIQKKYPENLWVNSGLQILSPAIFNFIPNKVPADLPRDVYMSLASSGKIFGMPLVGYRRNIDSLQALSEAENEMSQK